MALWTVSVGFCCWADFVCFFWTIFFSVHYFDVCDICLGLNEGLCSRWCTFAAVTTDSRIDCFIVTVLYLSRDFVFTVSDVMSYLVRQGQRVVPFCSSSRISSTVVFTLCQKNESNNIKECLTGKPDPPQLFLSVSWSTRTCWLFELAWNFVRTQQIPEIPYDFFFYFERWTPLRRCRNWTVFQKKKQNKTTTSFCMDVLKKEQQEIEWIWCTVWNPVQVSCRKQTARRWRHFWKTVQTQD